MGNQEYELAFDGNNTITIQVIGENVELDFNNGNLMDEILDKIEEYKNRNLNIIIDCKVGDITGSISNLLLCESINDNTIFINFFYKRLKISSGIGVNEEEQTTKQNTLKYIDTESVIIADSLINISNILLYYIGESSNLDLNLSINNSKIFVEDDKEYKFNISSYTGESNQIKGSNVSLFFNVNIGDKIIIDCDVLSVHFNNKEGTTEDKSIQIEFTKESKYKKIYFNDSHAQKYNITFPNETTWELKLPKEITYVENFLELNNTEDTTNIINGNFYCELDDLNITFNNEKDLKNKATEKFTFNKPVNNINLEYFTDQKLDFTFKDNNTETTTNLYVYENKTKDINMIDIPVMKIDVNNLSYKQEKQDITKSIDISFEKGTIQLISETPNEQQQEDYFEIIELKPEEPTLTILEFKDVVEEDTNYNRETVTNREVFILKREGKPGDGNGIHNINDSTIESKGKIKSPLKMTLGGDIGTFTGKTLSISKDFTYIIDVNNPNAKFSESFITNEKCNINISCNIKNNDITLNFVEKEENSSDPQKQIQFNSLSLNTNSTVLLNFPENITAGTPDIDTIELLGNSKVSFKNLTETTKTVNIVIPYGKKINDVLVGAIPNSLSYKITTAKPTKEQIEEIKKEIKKLSSVLLLFPECLTYSEKYLFKFKILKLLSQVEIMKSEGLN